MSYEIWNIKTPREKIRNIIGELLPKRKMALKVKMCKRINKGLYNPPLEITIVWTNRALIKRTATFGRLKAEFALVFILPAMMISRTSRTGINCW